MTPPTDAQKLQLQFERNHWLITHRVDGREISSEDYHLIVTALTAAAEVGPLPSVNFKDGKPYSYCPECGRNESYLDDRTIERCAQELEAAYAECNTLSLLHGAARLRALKDKP